MAQPLTCVICFRVDTCSEFIKPHPVVAKFLQLDGKTRTVCQFCNNSINYHFKRADIDYPEFNKTRLELSCLKSILTTLGWRARRVNNQADFWWKPYGEYKGKKYMVENTEFKINGFK